MKAKLQVALDLVSRERGRELVALLKDEVDILEVGTPLVLRYGLGIVKEIREMVTSEQEILADIKIVDAGQWESEQAFAQGATMVSVLAGASSQTLEEVKSVCEKRKGKMVVDLIDWALCDRDKIRLIRQIQPDYLALHLSTDAVKKGASLLQLRQRFPFLSELTFPFMLAGGVNRELLPSLLEEIQPQVVVMGSAVANSISPLEEVKQIRRLIDLA